MRKKIRIGFVLGLSLLLAVTALSCATTGDTEDVQSQGGPVAEDIGDPSTNSVIFGVFSMGRKLITNNMIPATGIAYLQMNTALEPEILSTRNGMYLTSGGVYFSRPVQAGGSYKLIELRYEESTKKSTNITTWYYGISGRAPWDLKAIHPGLNYFGTWERRRVVESPNELECLQEILPEFKGTNWQAVIEARIKELSK